ncbi:MAG TPA: extracellular solute-binding protein, partial [Caldilineaceae bacterium]|nr:extracellular solute-binding protein [Caldilineaceae bacterium]
MSKSRASNQLAAGCRRIQWLAALLACCLLGGCSALPELPPLRFWERERQTPAAAPAGVSVLGWTGGEAENRLLQERISAFEQSNPTIPVTGLLTPDYANALAEALRQDRAPDLFMAWGHQLPDLAAAGAVQPAPPAFDTSQALPAHLRPAVQVAGQSYCLPRDMATLALYYNPALFDRVEAAYPHDGWGWSDLRAAAEAVTDANNGLYGLVLAADASRLLPFLWQADSDGIPWSGSDVTPAIEFYVNLFADGLAVEPVMLDSTWNGEAFGRGRVAMTIEGSWLIPYLAGHFPELGYGVVQLPAGPARRATTAFVSCWAVSARAANPDAAF